MQAIENITDHKVAAIDAYHRSIKMATSALDEAMRCGAHLIEVKRECAHGEWKPWIAENLGPSAYRTAAAYMQLHKGRAQIEESKVQTAAPLSIDAALRLIATPREVPQVKAVPGASDHDGEWQTREELNGSMGMGAEPDGMCTSMGVVEPPPIDAPDVLDSSGAVVLTSDDWYTPADFLMNIRKVLDGDIDTDPASCEEANQTVDAKRFYSIEDDGLTKPWVDNVWCNPPYSNPTPWAEKFIDEKSGRMAQGMLLLNSDTGTGYFNRLVANVDAICFLRGRIRFLKPGGKETGTGRMPQILFYIGDNTTRFKEVFGPQGKVFRCGPKMFKGGV